MKTDLVVARRARERLNWWRRYIGKCERMRSLAAAFKWSHQKYPLAGKRLNYHAYPTKRFTTLSMQTGSTAHRIINIQLPSLWSFNEFPSKHSRQSIFSFFLFYFRTKVVDRGVPLFLIRLLWGISINFGSHKAALFNFQHKRRSQKPHGILKVLLVCINVPHSRCSGYREIV